jgi:hypothetical protein
MPANRHLDAWTDQDHALSVGLGFGFSVTGFGALFHLGLFALVSHSESDTGILVVGEAFLLSNPKPVGFAAFELELGRGKFGVLVGVHLTLVDLFAAAGHVPDWLANVARLTGTLYAGNQPATIAIGQLSDPRTWLMARIDLELIIITGEADAALCLQIVSGGPVGYGCLRRVGGTPRPAGRYRSDPAPERGQHLHSETATDLHTGRAGPASGAEQRQPDGGAPHSG